MSQTVAVEVEEAGESRNDSVVLPEELNLLCIPFFLVGLLVSLYSAKLLLFSGGGGQGAFPWWPFFLHLCAALIAALGILLAGGKHDKSRHGWALFTVIFSIMAGPLGLLGGALGFFFARSTSKGHNLLDVIKAEMFVTNAEEEEGTELGSLDLQIRQETQVEPIVDLLPLADVPTTIAIINRLREDGGREDIEMIRSISADPRPEVYQFALSILDKMEKQFAADVYSLSTEIADHPKDPALRIEMAKLHLNYIESGLLDDSLRDYYWELTLSHLFEAMLSSPQNPELGADFAHLLALQGLVDEASTVASVVLKKEPSLVQAQLLVLRAHFERATGGKDDGALMTARKTALENSWAVRLPRKRVGGQTTTYDLTHFWFGGEERA